MYRVEDKYLCNDMDFFLLQARIAAILEPDDNQYDEEGYGVVSLYFDDAYDTHLRDTVDGNSIREKYRIRIYNNSLDMIKLEVKSKCYNRVTKKSRIITPLQMRLLLSGEQIPDTGSLEDPATLFNIAIEERKLCPKVIVAYERKAYVHDAGNVRITFDRNVRSSSDIEAFGTPDIVFDMPGEQNSVLEIKYDEFLPGFVAGLLELGNMQQASFSKYRLCREIYMGGDLETCQ